MEPLLRGESSGRRLGPRQRGGVFGRADAIAYGSNYEKAAALIDLAEDGVGIPEKILDSSSFQSSARFYFKFTKCDLIWSLSYFALIVLNFLEKPLWCQNSAHSCKDREYFFLGQLPYLTPAECLIYEGITLVLLIIHTFFPLSYEGSRLYWTNAINLLKAFCLLALVADMLVYALYMSPLAFGFLPFRIAPYIRVVLFVLNIRELRDTIIVLVGMLDTYFNILALWFLFLVFSSWVAYVIFEDTIQGNTVFTSYVTTLYQMFLLFATANNPDVWVPAYKSSRWSILFFILFVLVGVYFVTNLILAVVYDSFRGELVKQVSEMDRRRRAMLGKAFDLLDTHNAGLLNKDQCIRLFEELNKYRTLPNISREEFELIFDELDDSHDVKINKDEFADICNAISLKFQKENVLSYFEYLTFYHSPTSKSLKAFVKSPTFGYLVSFILILNLVAVIIETTLDIQESSAQKVWQVVEFVFGWIYVIEMALKVYSFGFENYWRDGQNRFDFIITLIIVIGETITFVLPDDGVPFITNGEWIRYLLLARMLRLIRLLMHVKRYRGFVATFLTLIPSLMPYLGIIFCVLCIYCSLGVQIFGGIVNAGNPDLETTDLAANDYLLFNFNDYPNGMVTLFNLLVSEVWLELMESYTELTGTSWTYLYFISFYLITVLLLLNLIIAFVLEAFFAEIELESSETCDGNEKELEGDQYRRRPSLFLLPQSLRLLCFSQHSSLRRISISSPTELMTRAFTGVTLGLTQPANVETHKISFTPKDVDVTEWKGDILAVGVAEKDLVRDGKLRFENVILNKIDSKLGGLLAEASAEEDFSGKTGQSTVLRVTGLGAKRVSLIGLGSSTAPFKGLGEAVVAAAKSSQASSVAVVLASSDGLSAESKLSSAYAIASGLMLGFFEDNRYKSESKKLALRSVDIIGLGTGPELEKKLKYAGYVSSGIIFGRELVNSPANVLTPGGLAEEASKVASSYSDVFTATILNAEQCKELKMGSYLGVAAASANPPHFIHLRYKPPTGPVNVKLALVGKGLTFDSGGYNIKTGPGCSIELMKFDMGGSAAVLGAAKALGQIKPLGVEVHFIVAACENMISGTGMRPGDVVTASNGKTIEVNNTDAEGRLTLADALVYACNQGVEKIVDLATLTGACVVALGPSIAGVFTPSDDLAKEVLEASEASGEKLWRLPLEESYWETMKSGVADMVNTGGRQGGAIIAALFLKQFVDEKVQWMHIDMAGPVWNDKKRSGTGFGIATLVEWVLKNAS